MMTFFSCVKKTLTLLLQGPNHFFAILTRYAISDKNMATVMEKRRRGFGERLRTERERLGYTELQIAQLLGVPIEQYQLYEEGKEDPGIFRMPRLNDCGFDVLFIITSERHNPVQEESELLSRFRELSNRGQPLTSQHCSGPLSYTYDHHQKRYDNHNRQNQPNILQVG